VTARIPVAEQVARNLLQLIHAGGLQPGDQLPTEREIAATMGVSRPSVREALRGLQILGVVRSRQGGGIYVSSLDPADIMHPLQVVIALTEENFEALHEARVLVEGALGNMIGGQADDATLAGLEELVEAQDAMVGDPVAFRRSDAEFHSRLRALARNPYLERISEALYVLGMEYRRLAWETPGVLARSVEDHRTILAALRNGNRAQVAAATVRHMGTVHDTTRSAMLVNKGRKRQ
jgi:GntR family transcriptional regulator, transcriptional repressor for pyruvate dehydrogenase complex